MQVSAAKVLLGADAAAQSRETPVAFSSGPLADITSSAVGAPDGDRGASAALGVDAGSSAGGATTDSPHVNGSDGAVPTGSGTAQESAQSSKSPSGSTSINIISPDSRFSKAASATVSGADIFVIGVMVIVLAHVLSSLLPS